MHTLGTGRVALVADVGLPTSPTRNHPLASAQHATPGSTGTQVSLAHAWTLTLPWRRFYARIVPFQVVIPLRMNTQRSTNAAKVAVGYVRVSTQEQVSEGVSLDAQRDKLRAYCKCSGIKLIDIKADEGISGGTLERPGLQAALAMLRRGTANTLIVVKLDRLSRSLRDVCTLVEDYFGNERYHLLSLCGMANTHSAAGRMVLMNLANYAQFEREMISERTRDALRHMKAQECGSVPLLTDTRSAMRWVRTDADSWFRFLMNRKSSRRSRVCEQRGSLLPRLRRD